jgi:thiol:disulfide interchange protein
VKGAILKLILLGTLLLGGRLYAGELHWEESLRSAFEKASATNRPLMVMVVSKGCRWCKKMKYRTLKNDLISARLKNYVLVKIDRDEVSSEFVPYAKYVPTIYFMTPKQKILERVTGYFNVSDFGSWIDDADLKLKKSNPDLP